MSRILGGALALFICAIHPAQAAIYECSLPSNRAAAGMPPVVVIGHDTGAANAVIAHAWFDGPLQHDVPVRVRGERMDFAFTASARVSGRTAMIHFRGAYFSNQQRLSLSGSAGAGFEGNMRGDYSCRVQS